MERPSWWAELWFTQGIVDWPDIVEIAAERRGAGCDVVLANGVFDLLHPGHLLKLAKAAPLPRDFLIVSLDTDAQVRLDKGRPPVLSWRERAPMLAALEGVGAVTAHGEGVGPLVDLARLLAPCRWLRRQDAPEGEVEGVESVRLERQGSWASSDLRRK